MKIRDEIEQFRRELKSIRFWSEKIREINEEIMRIQSDKYYKTSVKDNLAMKSTQTNDHPYQGYADEAVRQLYNVRQKYIHRIKDVEFVFEKIADEVDRKMIFELYVLNEKYSTVAVKYSYAESTMFDRIYRSIQKCI